MARKSNDDPPANVMHGALRYVRSQAHLTGTDRTGARGGRDDVGALEQETWRGRDEAMRRMHSGPSGGARPSGGERGERGDRRGSQADQRLRSMVNEALTVHSELDASFIEVGVKDGVVTLSGRVSSPEQRRLAEDAAYVSGVVDVVMQLRVQRPSVFARAHPP